MPARLFGIGFMLPGLKLGWDWVQALIEVGRASAWQLTDVLSFGVWLLLALVCLVPGWILATIRRHVAIDPGRRTAQQVNDFLVYRWSSSRSLDEFTAVRLYVPPPASSTSRRTGVSHHVALVDRQARQQLLAYMDDSEDRARAVAQDIAATCALPFNDEVSAEQPSED